MHWTYTELQATPIKVRTYAWDCIRFERAAQNAAAEKQKKAQEHAPGSTVVPY